MKATMEWSGQLLEIDTNDRVIPFVDDQGPSLLMYMPGYNDYVMISVNCPKTNPGWYWNGDKRKPTFSPSILTRTYRGDVQLRNHVFVRNGVIEFLPDCSHELAGKKVELPRLCDWPEELKLWEDNPTADFLSKEEIAERFGSDGMVD